MEPLQILGYIAFLVGATLTVFSRIPKQTIANQRELIETYEKRLKSLEDAQLSSTKDIYRLTGQIEVYKELPLREMARAMDRLASSNELILKILTSDSATLVANTEITKHAAETVAQTLSSKS